MSSYGYTIRITYTHLGNNFYGRLGVHCQLLNEIIVRLRSLTGTNDRHLDIFHYTEST